MVLVPAKTTKRKAQVAQPPPSKKTKTTPAKKTANAKPKAGAKKGSPKKDNAPTDEENEEEVEQAEEEVEEGSGNEEEVKEEEEDEAEEGDDGEEEGNEEGDEAENTADVTAESEAEAKPEVAVSAIKKGSGPSKLEAYVFQNLNPQTSIADLHRVLKAYTLDTGLVNANIVVEFKPNVPKNFLESASKITFGGDNEKFTVGKYKPLEVTEYIDNVPPPTVNFKQWLKISVLDLAEGTTKEEVKEIVEGVVGEEVKVDTGNATSMVVTFQSEKSFGKLLIVDDLKIKDKAVRLKIPFVSNITRSANRRSDHFSPRKNGVSGSPVRGRGDSGNRGGFGGGRGGGNFYGKRGRGTGARMGGGYGAYGPMYTRY